MSTLQENTSVPFKFKDYKINNFQYSTPENVENVSVDFNTEGLILKSKKNYLLHFHVKVISSSSENPFISIEVKADFEFESEIDIESIPSYFYNNSIAIVFPYVRAFIHTLTSLANVKPLMLPLLNLTKIGMQLKDRTKNEIS